VRIVLDASAAYRITASDAFEDTLGGATDVVAPDLLVPELLNARWKALRSGAVAPALDDVLALLDRVRLLPTKPYGADAAAIAERLDHAVYDALYVAIAQRERGRLLTADERLKGKLRSNDLGHLLV